MVRSQTRTSARRRVPPLMSPLIHLRIKTAAGKMQKKKKKKPGKVRKPRRALNDAAFLFVSEPKTFQLSEVQLHPNNRGTDKEGRERKKKTTKR